MASRPLTSSSSKPRRLRPSSLRYHSASPSGSTGGENAARFLRQAVPGSPAVVRRKEKEYKTMVDHRSIRHPCTTIPETSWGMRLSPSPKSAPSLRPGRRMRPWSLPNLPCENCRGRTVRCRSTKCSRRWQHWITGRKVRLVASLPASNRRRAWLWPRNRKAGGNRVQGICQ
jgi:hypothetical protein